MNLRLRCLWTLTILILLLTWISGIAGAQIGIEYPFLLDIPASYNPSLWMALWNTNLTRIVNSPAGWLNHNYYPWCNPLT